MHKEDSEIVEVIKIMSNGKQTISEDDPQIKEMRDFMKGLTHPTEDQIHHYTIKNLTETKNFGEKGRTLWIYNEYPKKSAK